jgi:glycosyltransferase involved in cell wall biosynthesis
MFVITSMPVGGAETLLVEIIRRMDRQRFLPELCCLKELGPLGEVLAKEGVPVHTGLIDPNNKYDYRVLFRLRRLMKKQRIDAVVTVGTGGDKMFWGRLAARLAGVPVIASALHSTGLPDHVERLNRLLTPITDAFVAVAEPHGEYLTKNEGCPADRVCVIPNGVDIDHFSPMKIDPLFRPELRLPPTGPVIGIVAALRPEKCHERFLKVAQIVKKSVPEASFLVVGDGPRRPELEKIATDLDLCDSVRFVGTRNDIPQMLAILDVFLLTSKMEANPVSIMEAMAMERPVVAFDVGSIHQTVLDRETGILVPPGNVQQMADEVIDLIRHPETAARLGQAARKHIVENWSVDAMVHGYEQMIQEIYRSKTEGLPLKSLSHLIQSPEPKAAVGHDS